MCVIIHSMRKKYLERQKVIAAMKHNSSGFFMTHWSPDSKNSEDRKFIRTLSENEALDFFDKTPDDDLFVMHARIPSKGGVNVDNVHGWTEDGITFCHNMTMSSLSDLMKADEWSGTDSEYFFRKLFMPMHRGEHLADPNLKPGEMGPATKRLTALMCGESNKFLFIMPDNSVIRAGHWSNLASEKRKVMEEREVEEVVGETIDIDGKVTKRIQKIKKHIEVERELATVLASNTLFLPVETKATTGYTGYSGYSGYRGSLYNGYGYGYDIEDDEFDYRSYWEKRKADEDKTTATTATTVTPVTAVTAQAQKAKVKKSDINEEDFKKFLEWRKEYPGFKDPETITSEMLGTSALFDDLECKNGRFTGKSMAQLFNIMLRAIVYNNFHENSDLIIKDDIAAFNGSEDRYGLYCSECADLVDYTIPMCFDDSMSTFMVNQLSILKDKLDFNGENCCLPSEAITEMFIDIIRELDYTIPGDLLVSGADYKGKKPADVFHARMHAIDTMLNISFDSESKSSKDIEKYVKAGILSGRKLKWISPAAILSPDGSMVSDLGGWVSTPEKEEYLTVLNFVASAVVSDGASLDDADRKYLADMKMLGIDFDKKPEEGDAAEEAADFPPKGDQPDVKDTGDNSSGCYVVGEKDTVVIQPAMTETPPDNKEESK